MQSIFDRTQSSFFHTYFQVKIALYDADLTNLLSMTFAATNAGIDEWMSKERLIDSPYADITSAKFFSIPG